MDFGVRRVRFWFADGEQVRGSVLDEDPVRDTQKRQNPDTQRCCRPVDFHRSGIGNNIKTLSTGYLVLRGVVTAASLLFGIFGIYGTLTGDALGWPITICGVILTGFTILRIWLGRRIRLSKADSGVCK